MAAHSIEARMTNAERRERLEEFRAKWAPHKPDCAKVTGGGQLRLGESAATQVASQACTCGLWREFNQLCWEIFED